MNKDLAAVSAVWRALFGVRSGRFVLLICMFVKEPPKVVLRRMMGPSLETGAVFDAVLSVNYCANCDSVSVRAVQEKCDERGRICLWHRNVRCRQFGRAPLRLSPSASLGASAKLGRLSRKAREGAHPRLFHFNDSRNPRYTSRVNRAHPPIANGFEYV